MNIIICSSQKPPDVFLQSALLKRKKVVHKILLPAILSVIFILTLQLETRSQSIRITEYMYSGVNGEYIEFTNTGTTTVDMTGWSFDDDSNIPGSQSLGAFGIVQPGESVILTEAVTTTFRAAWFLCNGIKIIGGLTNNLSRNDQINLYNGSNNLVDRLDYGDQTFPGTIRTQNISGKVSSTGIGNNQIAQWTLSSSGDAEVSFASSGNDLGSPGKSTRATVAFNPCLVVSGSPTIVINVAATSNYLDEAATAPPASPYSISGVINDPTDPAKIFGLDFTIADDLTPVNSLLVTVGSGNTVVVPNTGITLTGTGASRNIKINPAAVGFAVITVSVNDGIFTTSYIINYGASAASVNTTTTRSHTGTSDASTAIMIDANYMFVADDENQILRLYDRQNSGLPLKGFDYDASLGVVASNPEVDIESSVRIGNRIYWLGSHSNSASSGALRPNRYRLFATDITGIGAATQLSYVGRYDNLRSDLINWDIGNLHGLGANYFGLSASAASGVFPEIANGGGFNIEGFTIAPDGTTGYISFRAPISPATNRTKALIVPLLNLASFVTGNPTAGIATFGMPIQLDLGGRGIREIKHNGNGEYLIIAGPHDGSTGIAPKDFRFYTWTGNAGDIPQIRAANLSALNANGSFESIVDLPNPLLSTSLLQVLVDNGDAVFYADGTVAKDLPDNNHKKFRSELIELGQPPVELSASFVKTNLSVCGGVNDGSITVTPTGGMAPYSYSWTGETGSNQTSFNAGNVSSLAGLNYGYYTVMVTDAALNTVTINNIHIEFAFSVYITNSGGISSSCGNTGSVILYGNAGVQPYSYSMDGVTYQSSNTFNNIAAGTYTAHVKDAAGCVSTKSITVGAAAPITVLPFSRSASSCAFDGSIEIYRSGGIPPYTYSLDGTIYLTNSVFTGLASASYTAYVKDSKGCIGSQTLTVGQGAALSVIINKTNSSSCVNDGSIQVSTNGGVAPYTYSINGEPFQAGNSFGGLAAGNYVITVKDIKNCFGVANVVIVLNPIVVTSFAINATNCTTNNGKIQLFRAGGEGPYTYSLGGSIYQAGSLFTALAAGTYDGYVKDSKTCIGVLNAIVVAPNCVQPMAGTYTRMNAEKAPIKSMRPVVYPNPGTTEFNLLLHETNSENVSITIADLAGRKVYYLKGNGKSHYKFGNSFKPGMYMVEIIQGIDKQVIKLIKE